MWIGNLGWGMLSISTMAMLLRIEDTVSMTHAEYISLYIVSTEVMICCCRLLADVGFIQKEPTTMYLHMHSEWFGYES